MPPPDKAAGAVRPLHLFLSGLPAVAVEPALRGKIPLLMPQEPASPPETFEACLDRLEKIVKELESGNLPLERALELFEEGMSLSENCRRQLDSAESRIEILARKGDGRMVAEPFRLADEADKT
ncbi:MAG: exodeoxyribonuclease VII small subunit [Dongiaceae bacterium]